MKKAFGLGAAGVGILLAAALIAGVDFARGAATFTLLPYPGKKDMAYYNPTPGNTATVVSLKNTYAYKGKFYYLYTYAGSSDIYEFNPAVSEWKWLFNLKVPLPHQNGSDNSLLATFAVYNDMIYVGGWYENKLYEFDLTGAQKRTIVGGIPETGISRMTVYNNRLYIGTTYYNGTGGFMEFDGTSLRRIPIEEFVVEDFKEFGGKLYVAGYKKDSPAGHSPKWHGELYVFSGGAAADKVLEYKEGDTSTINTLEEFQGTLYTATNKVGRFHGTEQVARLDMSDGKIFTVDFQKKQLVLVRAGTPGGEGIRSLKAYQGKLYTSTVHPAGPRIHAFDGKDWTVLLDRLGGNDSVLHLEEVYDNLLYFENRFGVLFVYNACHPNRCAAAPPKVQFYISATGTCVPPVQEAIIRKGAKATLCWKAEKQ